MRGNNSMTTNKTINEIVTHVYTEGVVDTAELPEGARLPNGETTIDKATKDIKALIKEARADERQAILDVLPGVNRIGYSGMCKTCEKPCDLDTCVCDGRNEAISEMKAAIKLMREEQL